jgi:hypothetical protein
VVDTHFAFAHPCSDRKLGHLRHCAETAALLFVSIWKLAEPIFLLPEARIVKSAGPVIA